MRHNNFTPNEIMLLKDVDDLLVKHKEIGTDLKKYGWAFLGHAVAALEGAEVSQEDVILAVTNMYKASKFYKFDDFKGFDSGERH